MPNIGRGMNTRKGLQLKTYKRHWKTVKAIIEWSMVRNDPQVILRKEEISM